MDKSNVDMKGVFFHAAKLLLVMIFQKTDEELAMNGWQGNE